MFDLGIPVLVPRRADHGRRDKVWAQLCERVWWGQTVVEGHHEGGLFNRSAALNTAAAAAAEWDLAVIADADSFVPDGQLAGAIALARRTGHMVIAHSRWVNVELDETRQILEHGWIEYRDHRQVLEFTVSSMLVVPRIVWDVVNGFDERFEGWGCEDRAFARACKVLDAPPLRIDGPVFHLAHERPVEDVKRRRSAAFLANERRWQQYLSARTQDAMQAMVAGNRPVEVAA